MMLYLSNKINARETHMIMAVQTYDLLDPTLCEHQKSSKRVFSLKFVT